MSRTFLEEDLEQIRRYFPGAKTVALHTPFDLSVAPENPWELRTDDFREESVESPWYGDLLWNQ
jgi:hypothetical protein